MIERRGKDNGLLELSDGMDTWRLRREPKWYEDIGYALEDVLRQHRYDYKQKGVKPDDPGWHVCSCGEWQGYWSGFHPHVADHLRAVVMGDADA